MSNKTSIYRKEIKKQGLDPNIHNFMRVYYPDFYKLSQEDQKELKRLYYGDKTNSIYSNVLINAINNVNNNTDLLAQRIFEVKTNPILRDNDLNSDRYSNENNERIQDWFNLNYDKLIEKVKEVFGFKLMNDTILRSVLVDKFELSQGASEKIVSKYYISRNNEKMLDLFINTGEIDTSYTKFKRTVALKKIQVECLKYSDDIFELIKNKYLSVDDFIKKEKMPFTSASYYQSRSNKRYPEYVATSLMSWYKKNKEDSKEMKLDLVFENEKPINKTITKNVVQEIRTLKPIVNASKTGIFGRKVVDEYKLSIIVKHLLNRLKNEELEDIKFVQEFEEIENKLKANDLAMFIRNTEDYQKKLKRYESINNDLKELAKVIEF